MSINAIANITVDLKAKIQYTIPESGTFLFAWAYRDQPFAATYQWRSGELAVMTDSGYEIAGVGAAEEYYPLPDLKRIVAGEDTASKFIAIVVIDAA